MTHYMTKGLTVLALSLFAAATLSAAEKEKAEKPAAAKAEKGEKKAALAKMDFLDKEHAPKGRGWFPLFNMKDLAGWKFFNEKMSKTWKVTDGILAADYPAGEHGTNIYSERKFGDFEIYYEFKVPKDGNSGVFLRGQYEIQIQEDHGLPAGQKDWGNGGLYGQIKPSKNASKPLGEWQSVYATINGKEINVWLNGEKIIDKYVAPKATHIYGEAGVKDGDPTGPIILQGDHKPIEFRCVFIKPVRGEKVEKGEKAEKKVEKKEGEKKEGEKKDAAK